MVPKDIVVYTQPGCMACDRVRGFLSENRVEFKERNVRQDRSALLELLDRGFRATPVTVIDAEAVAGFAPDRLEEILGL